MINSVLMQQLDGDLVDRITPLLLEAEAKNIGLACSNIQDGVPIVVVTSKLDTDFWYRMYITLHEYSKDKNAPCIHLGVMPYATKLEFQRMWFHEDSKERLKHATNSKRSGNTTSVRR